MTQTDGQPKVNPGSVSGSPRQMRRVSPQYEHRTATLPHWGCGPSSSASYPPVTRQPWRASPSFITDRPTGR